MLTHIHIENYRALQYADLTLAPLTVFVGENSSGKSTALQAVLLSLGSSMQAAGKAEEYEKISATSLANALSLDVPSSSDIVIQLTANVRYERSWEHARFETATQIRDGAPSSTLFTFNVHAEKAPDPFTGDILFPDVLYLGADRIGPQAIYPLSLSRSIGNRGENAVQYLDRFKNNVLDTLRLHPDAEDETLLGQVNYWLRYIVDTGIKTEGSSSGTYVEAKYSHGRPDADISPLQTGFGTSSVLPVVLACLSIRPGGLLLLENPEIHLHPRAQARLAELFTFVAKAGIQIMVETHCEHLVYKLCHLIYQNTLAPEQLIFHYKEKVDTPFVTIHVNERGRFVDQDKKPVGFPSGFFDATLQDYLAMYM